MLDGHTALQGLIDLLNSREPLTREEVEAIYKPFRRAVWNKMFATGLNYGQASCSPLAEMMSGGEADFRQHLRTIDNDMAAQVKIVSENVAHYFANGEYPPPYYAWRIAIILRKREQYATELAFLEAYARHFCANPIGGTSDKIVDRIPKTKRLVEKFGGDQPHSPHRLK